MKPWIYGLIILAILVSCWFGPVVQTNWEMGRDAGALFYTEVDDFIKIVKEVDSWSKKAKKSP